MQSIRVRKNHAAILAAASAASLAIVTSAHGQTVGAGQISISTAGSTALKNWLVAKTQTFTDVPPGTTLTVDGNTYPTAGDGGSSYWIGNGGSGVSYQLAPKNNTTVQGTSADSSAQIQFTYHESGAVEGVYELANDQIYTNSDYAPATGIPSTSIAYITKNVDRNPEGGNAVWLNYNQIGASGVTAGTTFNATTGATPAGGNGLVLTNFYGSGVGQTGTPGQSGTPWTPGSASNPTPTFDQNGNNVNGGQNAVQIALSDSRPAQAFANDYGNVSSTYTPAGTGTPVTVTGTANTSFNANNLDLGYGAGNSALPSGGTGIPGSRITYQSASVLNMPAAAQNPRAAQGTTFGVGAWNNATNGGLGNLNSQLTAVTATAFIANPGTGLTQVDRTDGDWLETSGRLSNGATFNMTTRDVNSGTRDVISLDTGVDPTFTVGKNDEGNGTLPNAVSNTVFDQESIGSAQRFSNKTAGGAQLRPTVQNNRMAVGTLSINDAGGNDRQQDGNPVRVLNYSDSTDGSSPYVSPNYATISNGTYVIYQNEVVVTVRAPGANYATNTVVTSGSGAEIVQGAVQGDDANGDVVTMLNNTANSVATGAFSLTPADPADGLLSQGYIIPSLMQVKKNFNGQGLDNSVAGTIAAGHIVSQSNLPADGGSFNQSTYNTFSAPGGFGPTALPDLTSIEPTTGTGSTYGGKGGTFAKSFFNGGAISITNNNYVFGNFDQTGVRDYNAAVIGALAADRALITADQAVSASVPGSEFTSTGDNNGAAGGTSGITNGTTVSYTDALSVPHTTLTKGDLIVMGDYTGDGHFNGADLLAMAQGASLSDNTGSNSLNTGDYRTGVLNKNRAMDYLNSTVGNAGADLYIRKTGAAVLIAASVPTGATAILNPITSAPVVDPVSGLPEFTYDPNGVNTFNKSDVNQDGVVDINDAVAVDNSNGKDFTNLGQQIGSTQQSPVTGVVEPLSLVMAKQTDGSTVVGASDVGVVNTQLTGTGNTNWYGFTLNKTGPNTITFARTGGTVLVYPGAGLQVSGGTFNVAGSQDPFTDNSGGATDGNHVGLIVNSGAAVTYAIGAGPSTVSSLSIDTASGSLLDLSNNHMFISYGTNADPATSIRAYLSSGYNGGGWNGTGLVSSAASAQNTTGGLKYALGYADSNDAGIHPVGLPANTIEVKYTLVGDLDLNGVVNGTDFARLSLNFGHVFRQWDQGDLDFNNVVNGTDFGALSINFGHSDSGAAVALSASDWAAFDSFTADHGLTTVVPEPASVSLLLLGGMGVLTRRFRRAAR